MENEKVLVKSQGYNLGKKAVYTWITGFVVSFILCVIFYLVGREPLYGGGEEFLFSRYIGDLYFWTIPLILFALSVVIGIILIVVFADNEIIVTENRVIGKCAWGKRVELPINQVTAIAMGGIKGVAVATASGLIKFSFIKNRDEIFNTVSGLLRNKNDVSQQAPSSTQVVQNIQQISSADELAKFKQLLDSGAITQEEYNAKKKQLLGL